jgi:hypothetical protein
MRKPTLLMLTAVTACTAEPAEYFVVKNFLDRSLPVACDPLDAGSDVAVTELRAASDSTFLVLDAAGRRVLELDADLGEVWRLEAPAAGPGSLDAPVSAVVLGDTAVVVAERRGLRLNVYDRIGRLVRSEPLPFVPHSLAVRTDGDVLVTAMPMGAEPGSLLMRYDGQAVHGLGVPARSYGDMLVSALGNSTLVEALPSGAAVVVHRFLAPRGFLVHPDGGVEALRVPTPDATVDVAAYVPTAPITEAQLGAMLVPAMAMSVDPTRSQLYVLTRSGRPLGDSHERAVLRLDERLGLVDAFLLDVPATAMAFLSRPDLLIVADTDDRFHACRLQRSTRHAVAD